MHKRCAKCKETKPHALFYKNRATTDGICTYCADCSKVIDRARHSAASARGERRSHYLKKTYGLTETEFQQMFDNQGRVCAICGEAPLRPVVDHCHDSGKIRGILCDNCNRSMGLLKDNIEILMSAASYLMEHEDVLATIGGE